MIRYNNLIVGVRFVFIFLKEDLLFVCIIGIIKDVILSIFLNVYFIVI